VKGLLIVLPLSFEPVRDQLFYEFHKPELGMPPPQLEVRRSEVGHH